MSKGKSMLFFLASGGMELCWIYAWAAFSMIAIMRHPFPFIGAIGTFSLAVIVARFSMGKGWRIVHVGGFHTIGFCCAALGVIYAFYYPSYPVFGKGWLLALFGCSRTPVEWIYLILILLWSLLCWIGGVTMARRPRAYLNVCSRFDIGLAAFFCLFLARFVLATKGEMKIDDPVSPAMIFPFFLLAFLAIGMVRTENNTAKGFLPGYQGVGVIISFIAIVLLSAGGLVLFFLPALTIAAKIGYRVVQGSAGLFFPVVERVLRFIFLGRNVRPEPSSGSPRGQAWDWFASSKDSWWMEVMEKVMGWGIKGVAALLLLFTLAFLIFYVIKWLFSRSAVVLRNEGGSEDSQLPWFVRMRVALVSFCRRIISSIRGYHKAHELYNALLYWGRCSGFPHFVSETPLEFSARLNYHFPRLKREIDLIVNAFNNEVYGQINLSEGQWTQARSAWHVLRSPLLWPLRLKVRFFGPGEKENY